MTQIGIGTYAFAWAIGVPGFPTPPQPMDYDGFIDRTVELGAGLVQIADNLPLHELDDDALAAFVTRTKSRGIAIEVGTRGIDRAHLQRYLTIAINCGSPILRIVVDTADHHPDPLEIIDVLGGVLPEFEAAGVTLAIENHDRFKSTTLADIIQRLDSDYAGICLDTVNSFGSLEGPEVVIETLGPHVVNLHIKDFTIGRLSHNMGFELTGTPAGQGMLNVPDLLRRLQGFGREFNAILELWPAYTGDIETTIEKEAAWARESMDYLREMG